MHKRGRETKLAKYSVRLYKLPRQPQLNYRLPSRPAPYCLYITNGSTNTLMDLRGRSLDQLAHYVADFIARENAAHDNRTMFHYIARFRESVPPHAQKTGMPLNDEECNAFHKRLHQITHHPQKRK